MCSQINTSVSNTRLLFSISCDANRSGLKETPRFVAQTPKRADNVQWKRGTGVYVLVCVRMCLCIDVFLHTCVDYQAGSVSSECFLCCQGNER